MIAAAAWLSAKLLTRAGVWLLAAAALVVALLLGAVGALLWVNDDLRDDIETQQTKLTTCGSSLTVSQQNVGVLELALSEHNKDVQSFADDCRSKDEQPAAEAIRVLQPPKEPRRFPEGAAGMNEWLATK